MVIFYVINNKSILTNALLLKGIKEYETNFINIK